MSSFKSRYQTGESHYFRILKIFARFGTFVTLEEKRRLLCCMESDECRGDGVALSARICSMTAVFRGREGKDTLELNPIVQSRSDLCAWFSHF